MATHKEAMKEVNMKNCSSNSVHCYKQKESMSAFFANRRVAEYLCHVTPIVPVGAFWVHPDTYKQVMGK